MPREDGSNGAAGQLISQMGQRHPGGVDSPNHGSPLVIEPPTLRSDWHCTVDLVRAGCCRYFKSSFELTSLSTVEQKGSGCSRYVLLPH
jgi:hypothetical protein